MSERKEIMRKVEEEKALRDTLKALKKEKRKENMKKLATLIVKFGLVVKTVVVWAKDKLVVVFKLLNSFRQAVNLQLEIKLAKVGQTNPAKLRRMFTGSITATAVIALLISLNIGDKDISVKEISSEEAKVENQIATVKGKGESVVMAGEIGTEEAEKVNKGRSIEEQNTESDEDVKKVISNDEVEIYLVGTVSAKYQLGTTDMSTIVGECYGQFSSDKTREDYVVDFFKYMNKNYEDMYKTYFAGSGGPGSASLNANWEKASKEEGVKFNQVQVEYKWNNLIKPTVDKIKEELNVDFTKTLLLQEVIFSTVSQYESEKAFEIIKKSGINDKMTDVEILNAIQDEKEASLGVYTYTDTEGRDDAYREIIKTRINNERIDLSRLVGKEAINI